MLFWWEWAACQPRLRGPAGDENSERKERKIMIVLGCRSEFKFEITSDQKPLPLSIHIALWTKLWIELDWIRFTGEHEWFKCTKNWIHVLNHVFESVEKLTPPPHPYTPMHANTPKHGVLYPHTYWHATIMCLVQNIVTEEFSCLKNINRIFETNILIKKQSNYLGKWFWDYLNLKIVTQLGWSYLGIQKIGTNFHTISNVLLYFPRGNWIAPSIWNHINAAADRYVQGTFRCLSPGRRQAIIWPNAGILLIGHWATNLHEILNASQFHWRKSISKYRLENGVHFVSASMC